MIAFMLSYVRRRSGYVSHCFYQKENGDSPVWDYLQELSKDNSKDSRIRKNKLLQYIKVLSEKGTRAGEPIMKHLNDFMKRDEEG